MLAFSLTPALSRREREKRSQLFNKALAESGRETCEFYEHKTKIVLSWRDQGRIRCG